MAILQYPNSLFTVTLILSIEFADAKNGKWKPGNENDRRLPIERTLQNDKKILTEKTAQNAKRIHIDEKMQNVRGLPIDRTLHNVRGLPIDRTLQNVRGLPIDRTLQNVRGLPIDRTLQNVRGLPIDRTLQNVRGLPIDRTLQNVRGLPIDRTLQNVRGLPIDRTLQNGRRFPIDRTLQNVRGLPIDTTLQNYRRMSTRKTIQNPRRIDKRLHSPITNVTGGVTHNEKRININRLLEHNQRTQNELKIKIDSFMQNENLQKDTSEQYGRRMLDTRGIQNDRKTHYLKITNSRRMRNVTKRMTRRHENENSGSGSGPESDGNKTKYGENNTLPNSTTATNNTFSTNNTTDTRRTDSDTPDIVLGGASDAPADMDEDGWNNLFTGMIDLINSLGNYELPDKETLTTRACYSIAQTYITALSDFKKHYVLRGFYQNNLQFEVGYLVAEITSKYLRMLELFHMTQDYFANKEKKKFVHSTYMFYLYTNILEMGTVIAHLCNMLNEMEDKYKFIPVAPSGFSDYHLVNAMDDAKLVQEASAILTYEKNLAALKKQKLKQAKKMRQKGLQVLHLGMTPTTVDRRPKYSSWPLHYGWSIEWF